MRVSWIFFGIIGITVSYGFSLDRSAPVGWDTIPVLETAAEQAGSFEKVSNGNLQVTGMDKILQTSEDKKSIKPEDEITDSPFGEKRFDLLASETQKSLRINEADEMKDDIIFPIEENSSFLPNDTQSENPRNVVLLFINESGQDPLALWTSLRTSNYFPVHGFLHSCRNEGSLFRVPSTEYFPSKQNDQCECENFLRSNVESLLSWAHQTKKMATGIVENTNVPIPLALGYGSTIFRQSSESSEEKKINNFRAQLHDDWHLIDLDKEGLNSLPSTVSAAPKQEGEGMWDFFDTFSKIRIALFQNWLKAFHKNAVDLDEFSPLKPILESSLVELMGDTVEKLKSVSNEKGFVMLAVAPGNKITSAIEVLEKEISARDTLLVVTGICSQGRRLVSFFAHGPGSQNLYDAKTIWDLPLAVKKAVSGCQGMWCKFEPLNPVWDDVDLQRRFTMERSIRNVKQNSTMVSSNVTEEAIKTSNKTEMKIENATVDHSKHIHNNQSIDNKPVQNSTKKSEVKSTESPSTKISEIPTVKPVTEQSPTPTDKKSENLTEKAVTKPVQNSTEIPEIKLSESPSTKISANPIVKPVTERSSKKLAKKEAAKYLANIKKKSEAENTTEIVKIEKRILVPGKNSGFSIKTTSAIIGVMTSLATTIFINF